MRKDVSPLEDHPPTIILLSSPLRPSKSANDLRIISDEQKQRIDSPSLVGEQLALPRPSPSGATSNEGTAGLFGLTLDPATLAQVCSPPHVWIEGSGASPRLSQRNHLIRSNSLDRERASPPCLKNNHCSSVVEISRPAAEMNSRNPPVTLATVLENMPLVYNSATKQLERRATVGDVAANNNGNTSPSPDGDGSSSSRSPLICSVAESNEPSKPFRRGHVRHSSYESSQINLIPVRSPPPPPPPPPPPSFERANSLHQRTTTDSLSSGVSVGSLSVRSDECSASAASLETAAASTSTGDSALDEERSKRGSLDRRSQLDLVEEPADLDDDDAALCGDARVADKHKRKGIALPNITLPRGLFSRKSSGGSAMGGPSWKLFGARQPVATVPPPPVDAALTSTTRLILEQRPPNLPAKANEESEKHRKQYLEMMENAKKKEQKVAKDRKKAQEYQKKLEEQVASAVQHWQQDILPRWEEMKSTKRCREMWWQGLPSSVRGRVWTLAIGNELNITPDLFEICAARAKERLEAVESADRSRRSSLTESDTGLQMSSALTTVCGDTVAVDRESSLELIHLDVSRTFPSLGIFQRGGPYYDLLLRLLGAYACYRPDVGYVQSMSFLAAILLLNLEATAAFVAFANVLNRPLQRCFFRLQQPEMTHYFIAYDHYFGQELPKLHAHFDRLDVRPDLYLIEWLYTLYAKSLPLDVTCRVWDVFFRDGEEFLFKTALGILRSNESALLAMDFGQCVEFLSHLPDSLTSAHLFHNIEPFMRSYNTGSGGNSDRRCFSAILADVRSASDRSNRHSASPSPQGSFIGTPRGHARAASEASLASLGSQLSAGNVKIGKSLSGMLGDWLTGSALAADDSH